MTTSNKPWLGLGLPAEDSFRLAVEAAPAAMFMVDRSGRIVLVNALTERLLGYTRDELVGQSIDRLVPARFRDQHGEHRAGFFADSRQRPMGAGRDLYAVRRDGSEIPVEIGLSPFETADGRFVLAAVTDITPRKEAEQALQEANRRKDEFLAMLAHELRNPLGAITNAAQLLKQLGPPEGNLRWARDVDRPAGRRTWPVSWTTCSTSHASPAARSPSARSRCRSGAAVSHGLRDGPSAHRGAATTAAHRACLREPSGSTADADPPGAGHRQPVEQRREVHPPGRSDFADCGTRGRSRSHPRSRTTGIGIAAEMLPRVFDLFLQGDRAPDHAPGRPRAGAHAGAPADRDAWRSARGLQRRTGARQRVRAPPARPCRRTKAVAVDRRPTRAHQGRSAPDPGRR